MYYKWRFSQSPVEHTVICSRYGRQMTMRILDFSLSALKLEANFDLGVSEPMGFAILTNSIRTDCKGKIVEVE